MNPNHARSGMLEFLDPRAGVEAVSAPGDPYGEPVGVYPESGHRDLPELALSLGAPIRGRIATHSGFV